jgi:pimeloyl-ACP methyl ester carboxylesterase
MSIEQGLRRLAGALCMSATLMAGPATAAEVTEGYFTTSDGVRIHYLEAGMGKPLVMIPGWSQTAAQFKHQLAGLSDRYHVYALDMRGHGESSKPNNGYRIHRLSKDVYEFLVAKNLTDVALAAIRWAAR